MAKPICAFVFAYENVGFLMTRLIYVTVFRGFVVCRQGNHLGHAIFTFNIDLCGPLTVMHIRILAFGCVRGLFHPA